MLECATPKSSSVEDVGAYLHRQHFRDLVMKPRESPSTTSSTAEELQEMFSRSSDAKVLVGRERRGIRTRALEQDKEYSEKPRFPLPANFCLIVYILLKCLRYAYATFVIVQSSSPPGVSILGGGRL